MTFAVYFLAIHPEVFHKLREEVLGNCGVDEMPTFDIIRNMPYREPYTFDERLGLRH